MQKTILVIDDEPSILSTLSEVLKDEGYSVSVASNAHDALLSLSETSPMLVLLDVWMPDADGIDTLVKIKNIYSDLPVIIMSGHGSIETAVSAIKRGAYDFIEKPLSLEKVLLIIRHAFNERRLSEENRDLRQFISKKHEMIGESPLMQKLSAQICRASPTQSRILISGENGTGKELVARAIHALSTRRNAPFIDINCAAIPEHLIESELFGYEKGAFTGALQQKCGQFECADGGTLFLDEIGDMALSTQSKVLRALQESSFNRVGGTALVKVDVRVIAASNKNLEEEIKKGTFREDLYYRLNVVPLSVPPLRERSEDIALLATHFIQAIGKEQGIKQKQLSPEALALLKRYAWPGNVRELQNILERLMILVPENIILPKDIPSFIGNEPVASEMTDSLKSARSQFEKELILKKLNLHNWNLIETAADLQIERTHLYRKMKLLNIETR
ncbi:MAG: sigma-54 dependent transcriptional regulator [Nitrospirota bacterium]